MGRRKRKRWVLQEVDGEGNIVRQYTVNEAGPDEGTLKDFLSGCQNAGYELEIVEEETLGRHLKGEAEIELPQITPPRITGRFHWIGQSKRRIIRRISKE